MATILRRDGATAPPASESRHPLSFALSDMSIHGDAYVTQIRAEASKIVQAARTEAAAIRAAAEAEGRASAESAMEQTVQQRTAARLGDLHTAIENAVDQLRDARGEWLAHWQTATVHLAKSLAQRLVRRELQADPSLSEAWVREALELAAGASEITVRLHPEDLENGRVYVEQLAGVLRGVSETVVVGDATIERGGCVVDTKYGRIDHRLDAQLDRLAQELL
ncbi:FliH/SctL family protein [Botrimarina hoheduenensis]|uniref:Flagellar assembly protein FliH n=1 Tax=Botrimarina hoheduenensis TaxID=2528000 RepID=A0A5C5W096_9BACT|nr:FliH/SctL family protein [Botrimarina hoheduenensis]TWT43182.1 Yop proteins translocation protein L [Botrimarina hoheduenensis]